MTGSLNPGLIFFFGLCVVTAVLATTATFTELSRKKRK